MNNNQKAELRSIVKSIPEYQIKYERKWLHEHYASDFVYSTFVRYLKVFRSDVLSVEDDQ